MTGYKRQNETSATNSTTTRTTSTSATSTSTSSSSGKSGIGAYFHIEVKRALTVPRVMTTDAQGTIYMYIYIFILVIICVFLYMYAGLFRQVESELSKLLTCK